jgi:hypothetical protein
VCEPFFSHELSGRAHIVLLWSGAYWEIWTFSQSTEGVLKCSSTYCTFAQ